MKHYIFRLSFISILIVVLSFVLEMTKAQGLNLTLKEAIQMAQENSFEAFRVEKMYLEELLNYQAYKKIMLPRVNLSFTPGNYDRSIIEEWDSEARRYKPYEVQSLNSFCNVSLSQNLGLTGGQFLLNSSLRRTMTYNQTTDDHLNFIANPLTLTYRQDFVSVNTFKWKAKIIPLQFEEAKQQYLENVESVTIKAVNLFFDHLIAELNYKIALLNKNYTDTLCLFGKEKLKIGAIAHDDYLRLELLKLNAGITLESNLLAKEQAQMELNNFLELPLETETHCVSTGNIPDFEISAGDAITKALQNNPNMIALKRKLIEADKAVKDAKANRFDVEFSAKVGLNQNDKVLGEAYQGLKDKQAVTFTLSIPILNWGESRREIAIAKLNKDLITESSRKEQEAIEINIIKMVKEFNIKHKQVIASAKADSISRITYRITNKQFVLGKACLNDINLSFQEMQNARNNYLSTLKTYWLQYYYIRRICLYNFEKREGLSAAEKKGNETSLSLTVRAEQVCQSGRSRFVSPSGVVQVEPCCQSERSRVVSPSGVEDTNTIHKK